MSFFDPQRLYEKPQYHSHKGQILQKKAYNRIYALSDRDLETAKNVLDSYGYSYYDHPIVNDSDFFVGSYQYSGQMSNEDSWSFTVLPLQPTILSNPIIQSDKPIDEFSLDVCLVSVVFNAAVIEDSYLQFGNYKIGSITFTADTDGDDIVVTNTMYSTERYLYSLGTDRAINPIVNDQLFSQTDDNNYLYYKHTDNIESVKDGSFFNTGSTLIYNLSTNQELNSANIYINIQYSIYAKYSV